jgi:D-threo-aldose 1-dehydrogenase
MKMTALGPSGPRVSRIGVGTSPLGGYPEIYGYDVDAARAEATVSRFLTSPVNFLDTSNEYSEGESERRIGRAIQRAGGLPEGVVLATKADPERGAETFDGDRVRASFRESAKRLGMSSFPLFHLHDPERFSFEAMTAPGGAVDAMVELRESGLVQSIGVAGGDIDEMHRYVDLGVFDVLLNHNQYTLLDRSANDLIDHALAGGMAFINAAPYASGMLSKAQSQRPRYQYREPPADIVAITAWLRAQCADHGVPLAALALQFSTRDVRVSSTVVGVSSPSRVDELVVNDEMHLDPDLWAVVADRLGFDPAAHTREQRGWVGLPWGSGSSTDGSKPPLSHPAALLSGVSTC